MEFPFVLARIVGEENSLEIKLNRSLDSTRGGLDEEFSGRVEFATTLVQGGARTWVAFEDIEEWEQFLTDVGAGRRAAWREFSRDIAVTAEYDQENSNWRVTVTDPSYRVRVTIGADFGPAEMSDLLSRLRDLQDFMRDG